jgi:hypothetical protein
VSNYIIRLHEVSWWEGDTLLFGLRRTLSVASGGVAVRVGVRRTGHVRVQEVPSIGRSHKERITSISIHDGAAALNN